MFDIAMDTIFSALINKNRITKNNENQIAQLIEQTRLIVNVFVVAGGYNGLYRCLVIRDRSRSQRRPPRFCILEREVEN